MAKSKPRTDTQRAVDDILTGLINNNPKARQYILKRVAVLSKKIQERFGDIGEHLNHQLVQVYVKGNSALKLYQMNTVFDNIAHDNDAFNDLNAGWSDFDNQIIINPYLPKVWWYEILNQIHHLIKTELLTEARDTFIISKKDANDLGADNLALAEIDDHEVPVVENVSFDYGNGLTFNGYRSLQQFHIDGSKLQDELGDNYREKYPALAGGFNIKHEVKMQSNVLLCMSSEYLHPINYFDNIRTLYQTQGHNLDFMLPQFSDANDHFPPAVHVLKDYKGKKVKDDSSIWINTTIGKFLLYRLIVRYRRPGISYDGKQNREDINAEAVKFRGEVIDISVPRRESEETLNQWTRFSKNLCVLSDENFYNITLGNDGQYIRVPDYEYQVEENINMINEVLTYSSGSPHKFFKRLKRAWPSLAQIQASTELSDRNPLHSTNVFTEGLGLNTIYAKAADNAIKCFFKQSARILKYDYYSTLLTQEIGDHIKTQLLPKTNEERLNYGVGTDNWLTTFNVKPPAKRKDDDGDTFLAVSIINDKIPELDRPKIKELLKCTKLSHQLNQYFGDTFALSLEHLAIVNRFRSLIESRTDSIKCFYGGLISSKLDLHFRLSFPYDNTYFLPLVPLYLAGDNASEYFATRLDELATNWVVTRASDEQKADYDYDYFITPRNGGLPHKIAVKFINSLGIVPAIPEQPLESLLLEQHKVHRVILNGTSELLRTAYLAIANFKKSALSFYPNGVPNRISEYALGTFELLDLLKKRLFEIEQSNNILLDKGSFNSFITAVKSLHDSLNVQLSNRLLLDHLDYRRLADNSRFVREVFIPELTHVKDGLLFTGEGEDEESNIFKPLAAYITKAHGLLGSQVLEHARLVDDVANRWQDAVNIINTQVANKLAIYALDKQTRQHLLLFSGEKNSRLISDGEEGVYRVLREKGVCEYIDHRISLARDFYLMHWLDHSRINYKSQSVSYTTTLTRQAND